MPRPIDDLKGKRFGRLTVLCFLAVVKQHAVWMCRCDCGKKKGAMAHHLKNGTTQSCGCYRTEIARKLARNLPQDHKRKHRESRSIEYKAWNSMLRRCINPKNPQFRNYGGRGITVCERWMEFENFLADMGRRPPEMYGLRALYSIERINNDGHYEPSNCKWATKIEQMRNRRKRQKV